MSDGIFTSTDSAAEALEKMRQADPDARRGGGWDRWFLLCASETTPGSPERAHLRKQASTIIGGTVDTVDHALAVADYQQEHPDGFTTFEAFCAVAAEQRSGAAVTRDDVMAALRPFGALLAALAKKKGATAADKDLRLGLMEWLQPRLHLLKVARTKHPRTLIQDAIKAAEDEHLLTKMKGLTDADRERLRAEASEQAKTVLEHPHPLDLVDAEMERRGYGGDRKLPKIFYLAGTARVLALRKGNLMPHTQALGASSAGKTYAMNSALELFPPDAFHQMIGMSAKLFVHDTEPLAHRILVFPEIDNIPQEPDSPIPSAIRNLLSEHYLSYEHLVKDPETGEFIKKRIVREGPTVLFTSGTKEMEHQFNTRLFQLQVRDDDWRRVEAALTKQDQIELEGGVPDVDPALVAYQALLQALAPVDVVIPYVSAISAALRKRPGAGVRVMRDYSKLRGLIKAVTVLHFSHRHRDDRGRLIADLADYAIVYDLTHQMYEQSSTGASETTRLVVNKVSDLVVERGGISNTSDYAQRHRAVPLKDLVAATGLSYKQAYSAVHQALRNRWLTNLNEKWSAVLVVPGEDPLPSSSLLPEPREVEETMARPRRTPVVAPGADSKGKWESCPEAPENTAGSTFPGVEPVSGPRESTTNGNHGPIGELSQFPHVPAPSAPRRTPVR